MAIFGRSAGSKSEDEKNEKIVEGLITPFFIPGKTVSFCLTADSGEFHDICNKFMKMYRTKYDRVKKGLFKCFDDEAPADCTLKFALNNNDGFFSYGHMFPVFNEHDAKNILKPKKQSNEIYALAQVCGFWFAMYTYAFTSPHGIAIVNINHSHIAKDVLEYNKAFVAGLKKLNLDISPIRKRFDHFEDLLEKNFEIESHKKNTIFVMHPKQVHEQMLKSMKNFLKDLQHLFK